MRFIFLVARHGGIRHAGAAIAPGWRVLARTRGDFQRCYGTSIGPVDRQESYLAAHLSTVSREMSRNGGYNRYRATFADENAWARSRRSKYCKLAINVAASAVSGRKLGIGLVTRADSRLAEEDAF